jgi:homoserine O-acetyltransferase/O-succinyltransferase
MREPVFNRFRQVGRARRARDARWAFRVGGVMTLVGISGASLAQEQRELTPKANESAAMVDLAPVQADAFFDNYRLRNGETFERLRLHYATLGSPHRNAQGEIDNAVMVLHWTGNSGASMLTPEYVRSLFASGQPLDAKRYYLITPDNLGHGQSSRPGDGLRAHFPHYGYEDLVDLQHKLITETLGIKRLHAILGVSMGGMNAWQWAEAYPDSVDAIMPVVALPVPISGRNLLWRHIVITDIRNDPDWQRGDYVKPPRGFLEGYQVLRMMIDGVPHLQAVISDAKAAEDFMAAAAKQNAQSDPNDLLYSLEASQDYNPEPGLAMIKAKVYALKFSDDEFNPDGLGVLQSRMKLVSNGSYFVQPGSPDSFGHLTMAHPTLWAAQVREFMSSLESAASKPAAADP